MSDEPEFFERYIKSKGYHSFEGSATYQTAFGCGTESVANENTIKDMFKYDDKYFWIRLTSRDTSWPDKADHKRFEYKSDLDTFSENLHLLKREIVLITGDGDRKVPSSYKESTYKKILECDKILKWYTQNYDGTCNDKKLMPYPIGLDLHTGTTHINKPYLGKLPYMLDLVDKNIERYENKIFSDVHLSNCHFPEAEERRNLRDYLLNNKCEHIDCLEGPNGEKKYKIPIKALYDNYYIKYPFILSTHGHGLDCHRTWEILFLGGIVITKTSSLDKMYEGLPVVIVNDWKEIGNIENVKEWYKKYSPLTNKDYLRPKLKYKYWLTKEYN
jgi:hypothetical protein|tara:strand:- start:6124 stop:7113 length:990 start_codon:yes stop_codon:yes gene_type:complete